MTVNNSAFAGIYMTIGIVILLLAILSIVCQILIFSKAGLAGWKALIPIYNIYCNFRIIGLHSILMLLLLVPGINLMLAWFMKYRLNRCFGMSVGFAVLFMFFSFIGTILIAFSRSFQYEGVV